MGKRGGSRGGGFTKSSRFGFNTTDVTANLQAAFDSGTYTVVIRNIENQPYIVQPMTLRSNKTYRLALGTVIKAKSGAFTDMHACLFNGVALNNVEIIGGNGTLQMLGPNEGT